MILIALGANLDSHAGGAEATFRAALAALADEGAVRLAALSRIYRSPAWPDPSLPEYKNAVAAIETPLGPADLLDLLHRTEKMFGRVRVGEKPNASRPLDLDLLDYDGLILAEKIILPHPRLQERAFVLLPLQDVAPDWRHPRLGLSVGELIMGLPQSLIAATISL